MAEESRGSMPLRTRMASFVYKRTSLPFRVAFKAAAHATTRTPLRRFADGDGDAYLAAHTREYFAEMWKFGYQRVYNLLSHLEPGPRDDLRVLSIGPRTQIELYYLWLIFGFSWDNVTGVDLVSPHPKIEIGDMSENLPFPDNAFDVVVASGCLEKSRDPHRTRDEIFRVARPHARVCVEGNRRTDAEIAARPASSLPVKFFHDGVYGFIDTYKLALDQIEYLNARGPSGFEIIFRVRK